MDEVGEGALYVFVEVSIIVIREVRTVLPEVSVVRVIVRFNTTEVLMYLALAVTVFVTR